MYVMVGEFVTESNANVPKKCNLKDYDLAFDKECIQKMRVEDVFMRNGINIIPSIYANAGASGVVDKNTFIYIESIFLKTIKENIRKIDGIFLMLHGASEIEELGSGDHHILSEIRKLVGPYLPIAIVCDPHGNLSKEYVESATIIRSYRESPHTDADQTMWHVADLLCELLKKRQNIHAVYRKLPLILGGEQSVSTDEPVKSINQYMNKLEKDPRIMSCSWHVGYIRHDTSVAGSSIVVVPSTQEDQIYAEEVADNLYSYVWDKRHEFHYTGLTAKPDDAIEMAFSFEGKPVFITDSGDNVTSGSTGWNTFLLRKILNLNNLNKKVLFASICDPMTYQLLERMEIGQEVSIRLGTNFDELSKSVELDVIIKSKGNLNGFMMHDNEKVFGHYINVQIKETLIEVMVADNNWAICEIQQLERNQINIEDYDVIFVKQGYIFPDFKKYGKLCIMALTDGATLQDTSALPFKRIMRPMYPIDNI